MSVKIIGAGKGIPSRQISNDDLAKTINTSDEWIYSRTGIKSRRICTDETLTDISAEAAEQAIASAGIRAADIDHVICATVGGDWRIPSLSCAVAERIGTSCPAFDINAACTGFVYALQIASGLISVSGAKNILIVCAEMMSTLIDWNDRNTCILFGDGAAACVVTRGDALKYINLAATADTSILYQQAGTGNSPFVKKPKDYGYLHMQGQEVFKFAVSTVDSEIKLALDALKMTSEQIDYFVLHQANKRIIDSIRNKLKQPEEKFPVNIESYGNLSSVSVPLLICEMLEDGRIKKGDTLLMSAFGAGLTFGSCVMVWE